MPNKHARTAASRSRRRRRQDHEEARRTSPPPPLLGAPVSDWLLLHRARFEGRQVSLSESEDAARFSSLGISAHKGTLNGQTERAPGEAGESPESGGLTVAAESSNGTAEHNVGRRYRGERGADTLTLRLHRMRGDQSKYKVGGTTRRGRFCHVRSPRVSGCARPRVSWGIRMRSSPCACLLHPSHAHPGPFCIPSPRNATPRMAMSPPGHRQGSGRIAMYYRRVDADSPRRQPDVR